MSTEKLSPFCALPFISQYTFNNGSIKICCDSLAIGDLKKTSLKEAWNGDVIKEVRRSFLKGEKHPVCQKCWDKEAAGLQSARMSHGFDTSHIGEILDTGEVKDFPRNISLRLGNICNYKCIMCEPQNSTKWAEDFEIFQKYNGTKNKPELIPAVNIESLEEWLSSSKNGPALVYFVGGEPLLSADFRRAVQFLSKKSYSKDLTLRIFTNFSVDVDWLWPLAGSFKQIEFSISIDGIEDHYNYIRYPGNWDLIDERINRMIQTCPVNVLVDFFFVLMSVNIFNLSLFSDWVSSKEWKHLNPNIFLDLVTEPAHLDIKHLKVGRKKQAFIELNRILHQEEQTRIVRADLKNAIKYLESNLEVQEVDQHEKLLNYLKDLDAKRNTNSTFIQNSL